jgi:hypothetical protein
MLNDSVTNYYYNCSGFTVNGSQSTQVFCNTTETTWFSSAVRYFSMNLQTIINISVISPVNGTAYNNQPVWMNISLSNSSSVTSPACLVTFSTFTTTTNYTMLNQTNWTYWYYKNAFLNDTVQNATFYCRDYVGYNYKSSPVYFNATYSEATGGGGDFTIEDEILLFILLMALVFLAFASYTSYESNIKLFFLVLMILFMMTFIVDSMLVTDSDVIRENAGALLNIFIAVNFVLIVYGLMVLVRDIFNNMAV